VIKYDYAVTALQFDSRKIVTAAGESGVKVMFDQHNPLLYLWLTNVFRSITVHQCSNQLWSPTGIFCPLKNYDTWIGILSLVAGIL
jgi:hypothetical protein